MHQHEIPDFQFCPVCGGKLNSLNVKELEPDRLVCSECSFVFYLDPKLVACTIVEMDGKVLLLKRAIQPQRGKWVIPGGYVDRGEEVQAAALRETQEECGLKVRVKDLLGVYSYPGRLVVVVVYLAEYLSGEPIAGDESQAVELFPPDAIPWKDLGFHSTVDALKDFCNLRNVR